MREERGEKGANERGKREEGREERGKEEGVNERGKGEEGRGERLGRGGIGRRIWERNILSDLLSPFLFFLSLFFFLFLGLSRAHYELAESIRDFYLASDPAQQSLKDLRFVYQMNKHNKTNKAKQNNQTKQTNNKQTTNKQNKQNKQNKTKQSNKQSIDQAEVHINIFFLLSLF